METTHASMPSLAPFKDTKTVVLTSFRRSGVGVPTAVHLEVVDDTHAIVRTWDTSGKAKRIRHTPIVTIAPATTFGKPIGDAITLHAEMVVGEDPSRWSAMLARSHPLVQGALVQRFHKLTGKRTTYIRLTPTDAQPPSPAQPLNVTGK